MQTRIAAVKHYQSKLHAMWDLFKKFTRGILADGDALWKQRCIFEAKTCVLAPQVLVRAHQEHGLSLQYLWLGVQAWNSFDSLSFAFPPLCFPIVPPDCCVFSVPPFSPYTSHSSHPPLSPAARQISYTFCPPPPTCPSHFSLLATVYTPRLLVPSRPSLPGGCVQPYMVSEHHGLLAVRA